MYRSGKRVKFQFPSVNSDLVIKETDTSYIPSKCKWSDGVKYVMHAGEWRHICIVVVVDN